MSRVRRALTISALTLLALLAFPLVAYTLSTLPQQGVGAVTFKLELYDESGKPYTDILGREAIPSNFRIYAQVFAITPPDDPAAIREVFKGEVKGLTLRIEARGLFKEIVDKWVSFEERRGTLPTNPATALQLNLWIVDRDSGELLQWVSYYYHYSPVKVKAGGEERHTVKIAVPPKKGKGDADKQVVVICFNIYEWVPVYTVRPEDYADGYGSHIRYHNGAYYVRTPVLALYNYIKSYLGNSPMSASIVIRARYTTNFYVSIGVGFELAKKLMRGDTAGVIAELDKKVYIGGVTSRHTVHFGDIMSLIGAGEEAYIYIWARPILIFYEEWAYNICTGTYEPTGKEKVEFFIQDAIKVYRSGAYYFDGGVLREPLPSFIRNWIFNESLTESKYITMLSPGETVTLSAIIDYHIDTCNVNIEIPTAILIAPVLFFKLPWALPLAVLIAPVIGYSDDSEIFIDGVIKNEGDTYYETLYMRLSKVQYRRDPPWYCPWCDPCYYRVPVSMYFTSN